jgi:TPR repeat protein
MTNEEVASMGMEQYYSCCGKTICKGCMYSFCESGNDDDKCPFCNSDRASITAEEQVEEMMKRVKANDPASICLLGNFYQHGVRGFQQDHAKAMELYAKSAERGSSRAHNQLGGIYHEGGNLKKAKFHWEAAAMAGHEAARNSLGNIEFESGNMERAIKHWTIAASAGDYDAMHHLLIAFKKGYVSRESMDSTLAAYNNSCAEVRSETRDAYLRTFLE